MSNRPFPGPVVGRSVLLVAAYAPVLVVIGLRLIPSCLGLVLIGAGVAGTLSWVGFLKWLPGRQPRTVEITEFELIDSEVTAYLVSLLLPLIAAGDPSGGDLAAYTVSAALILFVAFQTDLAAVNPFIYLFGYRVARANVEGVPRVMLSGDTSLQNGCVTVRAAIGVILLSGDAS